LHHRQPVAGVGAPSGQRMVADAVPAMGADSADRGSALTTGSAPLLRTDTTLDKSY
jgi:hypothetical protein